MHVVIQIPQKLSNLIHLICEMDLLSMKCFSGSLKYILNTMSYILFIIHTFVLSFAFKLVYFLIMHNEFCSSGGCKPYTEVSMYI